MADAPQLPAPQDRRPGEARMLARATLSSLAATLVDGIAYQLFLNALPRRYVIAAFSGAVLGAVTNFVLNRYWAFPPTGKKLWTQAWLYALASGATYLGLQGCLWFLIEIVQVNERVAWLPSKIAAWLAISYPLHRFLVFGSKNKGAK